ncbi:MFS transporter [Cohnella sp. REN36]|uniref:MFS transporter n=1 Tax=Cohnella sp. REN36 TaxID=2887347 RepID=UPI001D14BA32|nr:MFS transporter [Cohnella sp. REN36]MCC3374946.1 MFS transporter [Cohnella sp. REN36]
MISRQPQAAKDFRRYLGSRSRTNDSEIRRGMRASLREGIPANIVGNLLGGPLQTAFLLYLGFSSEQIGLVAAIPSFTLLIQIFIALGMQRWRNRRRLVTIFGTTHRTLWVATGLIPLLFPEASWAPLYLIVFLLSFSFGQAGGVIWTSLMADIVPPSLRGRYFGIRNTTHWAVVSLTLLLGGQLMEWIPGGRGFTILFAVSALCVVWNGIELSRYANPPFQPSQDGGSAGVRLFKPLRDRGFVTATLFITIYILAQNIVVPLFSFVMLHRLHLSYSSVTLITMLQNIVMMVSYIYWGNLNARYPARTLLLWTFPIIALACLAWFGLAALPVLLVLGAVHILLGIGLGGYNLLVFNFLIGDTPKAERPMYVAVFSALTGIAGFVGPIVGGWVYKAAGDAPAWIQDYGVTGLAGAVLLLLSVAVAPLVFRRDKKGNV